MMGEVTLVDFGHYFKGGILLVNPSIDVDVFSWQTHILLLPGRSQALVPPVPKRATGQGLISGLHPYVKIGRTNGLNICWNQK